MQDWIDVVKEECFETVRLFFVSFYGIIPYVVGVKNGASLEIVYQNLCGPTISIAAKLGSVSLSFSAFSSVCHPQVSPHLSKGIPRTGNKIGP